MCHISTPALNLSRPNKCVNVNIQVSPYPASSANITFKSNKAKDLIWIWSWTKIEENRPRVSSEKTRRTVRSTFHLNLICLKSKRGCGQTEQHISLSGTTSSVMMSNEGWRWANVREVNKRKKRRQKKKEGHENENRGIGEEGIYSLRLEGAWMRYGPAPEVQIISPFKRIMVNSQKLHLKYTGDCHWYPLSLLNAYIVSFQS